MIELIPGNDPHAAREHFEIYGHVGINGTYPIELAERVVPEVLGTGLRFHPTEGVPKGRTAHIYSLGSVLEQTSPGLKKLVDAVGEQAGNLGRNLWPVAPGHTPLVEILTMPPGVEGPVHTDKPYLKEAVAITTLSSSSELLLPDNGKYLLVPGVSVFLDPSRQLPHKAIAGPEGQRVAVAQSVMRKKSRA